MANQAGFLIAAAAFCSLFASGPLSPVAADSRFLEDAAPAPSPAQPLTDFSGPVALPGEPGSEQSGSGADGLELASERAVVVPAEEPKSSETATADGQDADVEVAVEVDVEVAVESIRFDGLAARAAAAPVYPVTVNTQVQFFVDRFTSSRRDLIALWLNRAGRYMDMIRTVFRGQGLPEDLAFTAMIESGFNPLAVSRVGAKGMWQFMAGTARRYGLRVDQWVDERLDPDKSTVAAAAYLRDLHAMFGSWTLAQAAYNAGEMKIVRAIRVTRSTDFWTLARTSLLKRETKDFVPQIQAATIIGRDPQSFGFDIGPEDARELDVVAVPPSTDLRRLSSAVGVAPDTLRSLNPVLVRGVTPPGLPWELKVPTGTREGILAALDQARRPRTAVAAAGRSRLRVVRASSDVHVVRPKDTVSSIAKQYGVSIRDVLRWNSLARQDRIKPGDRIRVSGVRSAADRDGQGGFR